MIGIFLIIVGLFLAPTGWGILLIIAGILLLKS